MNLRSFLSPDEPPPGGEEFPGIFTYEPDLDLGIPAWVTGNVIYYSAYVRLLYMSSLSPRSWVDHQDNPDDLRFIPRFVTPSHRSRTAHHLMPCLRVAHEEGALLMIQDLALVSRTINCLLRKLERRILEEMEHRLSWSLDTPATPSQDSNAETPAASSADPSGWVDVVEMMRGEQPSCAPGSPVSLRGRGSMVEEETNLQLLSRLYPWVEFLMVGVQELVGYHVMERIRGERQPPLDPQDDVD